MRPVEKVLERVEGVEERPNGFWALCPAHDDRNPSLHVEEGEDGRVLLKCRAGCEQSEVMAALEERGLRPRDLFPEDGRNGNGSVIPLNGRARGAKAAPSGRGRLVRTFEVKGPDGELVALHERYETEPGRKTYAWRRRPGGPAGLEGLPLKDLPLFGSERVDDWPGDAAVVLVEGEPPAEALRKAGIRALGTVCGAQSVPGLEALEVLRGHPVILWPDGDEQGRQHMERVATVLQDAAASVRWYGWTSPPAGVKGPDAADHPAVRDRDPEGLQELRRDLAATPEWEPTRVSADGGAPPGTEGRGGTDQVPSGFHLTDLGNSERFVARHGEQVRYCYPWGKWLAWTGARWERDDSGRVHRLAKETVRAIYQEAAAAADDGARKAIAQHATRSEAEAKIKAMLELAKSEVPVSPDELDADPWLLNAANGTVDLRTGELRPHRREDLVTKLTPVHYDPDAEAPTWAAFLEKVLPGEDLRAFVRRASGYSATGDTSEQCMFINHGGGNNGKSTFQEALAAAMGDYSMRTPTETLMVKRSGGVPNDVARLKGARFVTASETEEGRQLAESLVKDLTGQDTISARFMRAEWFDFKPSHKLWLSTNHKPEIRGTDNAIWRRIRLVPWTVTVPPAERDQKLPEKLRDELPGVLAWAVRGCLEWRQEGLKPPDEVKKATGEYRAEMDVFRDFFAEKCVIAGDAWAMASDLLTAYDRWRVPNNERELTMTRFGRMMVERGFRKDRLKSGPDKGKVFYAGIGLLAPESPPDTGSNPSPGEESGETLHSTKPQQTGQKMRNSVDPVKSSEGEIGLTAGNSPIGGDVKTPFTTLHQGQTLHQDPACEELAAYLDNPPRWLLEQAEHVRLDPAKLKPTCSSIAYEVYGYSGRGIQIEDAVAEWIAGRGGQS